jgi:hypothetical protein
VKPRNPEAARLEADYLARLRSALAGRETGEVEEVLDSVSAHIEEELSGDLDGQVSLVQMAGVLERLGPPESYLEESEAAAGAPPPPAWSPPPEAAAGGGSGLAPEEREAAAALLDRVWWGYLVAIIGLYVPLIGLDFCAIIGATILAVVLLRHRGIAESSLRFAGKLAVAALIVNILNVPASILALIHPAFGLLRLPVVIGALVVSVMLYWNVLDGAATGVSRAGRDALAERIRGLRVWYLLTVAVLFVVGLLVGVIAVASGVKNAQQELWGVGYVTLPLGWLFGWFFALRPIGWARDALRSGQYPADRPSGEQRAGR